MSAPETLAIETRDLSKTYRLGFWMNKRVLALQGLTLNIQPGQVYGLLGPNGAGKSTTIKILMNLVQATSGSASIFGHPPESKEARRHVGFLPENPAPYEYLTGEEFVRLAGQLVGLSGQELDQRVKEVLGAVGMSRTAGLQIRRYSKGMVQRVGLAQAIVGRPKLLVLDEPTSGLDPVGRREIRDLILQERERGTTVLFCTHIIPDVEALCNRVAVLVNGRLAREGSVQELLTTQVPVVELTIEGLGLEAVRNLGHPLEQAQDLTNRVLVRASNTHVQPLLKSVLDAGGRVTQLQSARFSLEDLFLQAMSEARHGTVGGEITS
ncbi:ABC-2 type transport system ATP-binding protein [Stigmatella aurantiaca]|uniref:ABC-2 type transport system ATP-binding protein n=1 Tax=Stigmatella aurantiaca TaxID=41 RepID=A0A1H8CGD6_STIAU|nr:MULTISPECIES: ABC transporter ATP-binding protein [Stigmatella]SEM93147.1 ABC-2 type transport system ATP-binding protein [Stigmatella aurantiaca]